MLTYRLGWQVFLGDVPCRSDMLAGSQDEGHVVWFPEGLFVSCTHHANSTLMVNVVKEVNVAC